MPCTIPAGTVVGVEGVPVQVEVDLVRRLPRVTIVGLPANAVRESAERVRSAILSSGLEFPKHRITINLAPADVRKDGAGFDLPIALGILAASGQVPEHAGRFMALGELSLNGELREVPGVLPLAMLARELAVEALIVPEVCGPQAACVPGLRALTARTLAQVVDALNGKATLPAAQERRQVQRPCPLDLSDVAGQHLARRALEVAAAGGHHLLMLGPPGAGKSMLAARLGGILPRMGFEEALEVTRVHSVAGLLPPGTGLMELRPFRAPHHSVTAAGLIGSATLRPGELSLAHHGVLFLDELPEFSRHTLEQLREPLENRRVVLARAGGSAVLPASCMLVAAANPCPCGYLGHARIPCRCPPSAVERYRQRLSGPLLDRIDLKVHVGSLESGELLRPGAGEPSASVRARVEAARRIQAQRYAEATGLYCNAELSGPQCRQAAQATPGALRLLGDAVDRLGLSGRGCDRVLKVARTLSDLDALPRVDAPQVAEALALRAQEPVAEAA